MGNRRFLTGLLLVSLLGAASPGSGVGSSEGPRAETTLHGLRENQVNEKADIQVVTEKMRGLGFEVGQLSSEDGKYLIPVRGVRARSRALRQRGLFKPFVLMARVEAGQVVLDEGDLKGAGIIVIDGQALLDMGVRVERLRDSRPSTEPFQQAQKTRPAETASAGKTQAQTPAIAGPRKIGSMRWSSVAMARPNPARTNPPPPPGKAVNIQAAERKIDFKSSVFKVNKRAPLAYAAIPLLDPGKAEPTPIENPKQVLPALPNGESMTAEDYYRELNLLEKDFNSLGYSLDSRRDAGEEAILQEIPAPAGQNGTRVKMDAAALSRVRSKAADYKSALGTKQGRLAALGKTKVTPSGKTAVKATEKIAGQQAQEATRIELQRKNQRSLEEALGDQKLAMRLPPNPYKKEINPTVIEKGDRDIFAIALDATSRQEGSLEAMRIVNGIGVRAYLFGNSLSLVSLMGTTYAPAANGEMVAELALMILGNNISWAGLRETAAVPAAPLSETAGLPPVGGEADWSTSLDVGYGMTFMAGPIPVSVRIGARATLGLEYTLLANPVRVENEIAPYAYADIYAQGGINLLIVEAGVECELTLLDTRLTVHAMLQRGASDGREYLDTEYFVHRWYSALSGDLNVYAYVYVPRWGLPPWTRKKYSSRFGGWNGYSDDLWEPALTQRKHFLLRYPGTSAYLVGANY